MRSCPANALQKLRARFGSCILVGMVFFLSVGVVGCFQPGRKAPRTRELPARRAVSSDLLCLFASSLNGPQPGVEASAHPCECLASSSGCEYVDLGGDRRRAIRLVPGSQIRLTARVLRESRLRFSLASYGADANVVVTVDGGDGSSVNQVFAVPSARLWTDADVSLIDVAGAETVISIVVDGEGDVAFAIPRLVQVSRPDRVEFQPNVLLYLIDTLRADHVSTYGYSRATTPFLDEVSQRGVVYLNSYSTSAWTRPSTASLLTGLYPSFHQANARMRLPLEVSTIAEILRLAGWSTWAFVTNGNVNASGLDFEQGFDRFVAIKSSNGQPNADQINDLVIPWLEKHGDEPFFLYLHSVDPHAPYDPPESVRFRFTDPGYRGPVIPQQTKKKILGTRDPTEADLAFIKGLYDEEILYQDSMIRELIDAFEAYRLVEHTYCVITSDHGEEFHDHGYWEHGKRLFEEQIRVPLIVIPPTALDDAPARVSSPVQGVDLVPSILTWVGIDYAKGDFQGVPLPASNTESPVTRPVYCEEIRHDSGFDILSLKDGPLKIISKKNRERGGRKTWLFNLEDDPFEQENLFSRDSAVIGDLMRRLENFSSTELLGQPAQSVPEPSLDQDALDQLRALGYIE
jgi:arylsulfatase A-like enzyme